MATLVAGKLPAFAVESGDSQYTTPSFVRQSTDEFVING